MPQSSLLSFFSSPVTSDVRDCSPHATPTAATQPTPIIAPPQLTVRVSNYGSHRDEVETQVVSSDLSGAFDTSELESARTVPVLPRSTGAVISRIELLHLPALKRITSSMLQVKYPDVFFTETVHDTIPAQLSRVAVFESKPIGWIRSRLEPGPDHVPASGSRPPHSQVYIQALCLLAPHRGQGIASSLLESVCREALLHDYAATSIYAHVWENNVEALEWYEKRGFRRILLVEHYYRRFSPAGAWLVRKDLR